MDWLGSDGARTARARGAGATTHAATVGVLLLLGATACRPPLTIQHCLSDADCPAAARCALPVGYCSYPQGVADASAGPDAAPADRAPAGEDARPADGAQDAASADLPAADGGGIDQAPPDGPSGDAAGEAGPGDAPALDGLLPDATSAGDSPSSDGPSTLEAATSEGPALDTTAHLDATTAIDGPVSDACSGCLISDICIAAGYHVQGSVCTWCDPQTNASGWSDYQGDYCDTAGYTVCISTSLFYACDNRCELGLGCCGGPSEPCCTTGVACDNPPYDCNINGCP